MRSQIPDIYPDFHSLPVVKFRPSGRKYLLLGMDNIRGRKEVRCELVQYQYDPLSGDIYGMRAFTQDEPCGSRWVYDEQGNHVQRYWLLRFDQVDCRYLEPTELTALACVLRSIVSAKSRSRMDKQLAWFRDENVPEHIRRNFNMTPATTPQNPIIENDEPVSSMIVPSKPFSKK